jgi:hypothetical protein
LIFLPRLELIVKVKEHSRGKVAGETMVPALYGMFHVEAWYQSVIIYILQICVDSSLECTGNAKGSHAGLNAPKPSDRRIEDSRIVPP